MHNSNPELVYVETDTLQRISDQQALNDYMLKQSQEKYGAGIENLALHRMVKVLRQELSNLPRRSQELIHMKYWEDQEDSEIAKKLNISLKTLRSLLMKTLEALGERVVRNMRKPLYPIFEEAICICTIDG